MPTIVSGMRIARSFVTPAGAAAVTREIDFQLGSQEGVEILGVLGTMRPETLSGVASFVQAGGVQTLHLETGSLETVPADAGEDEDTIDTEQFYRQDVFGSVFDGTTEGAASIMVTPSGMLWYPESSPIRTARNITHRGEGHVATDTWGMHVMIYYRFVRFTLAEMGVILARRS